MPSRKARLLKKQIKNRKPRRVAPKDIVRAIDDVEAAGLQIYGVEITPTGSIRIITTPLSDSNVADKSNADPQAETEPSNKQI
jgi:hypothetical protein